MGLNGVSARRLIEMYMLRGLSQPTVNSTTSFALKVSKIFLVPAAVGTNAVLPFSFPFSTNVIIIINSLRFCRWGLSDNYNNNIISNCLLIIISIRWKTCRYVPIRSPLSDTFHHRRFSYHVWVPAIFRR